MDDGRLSLVESLSAHPKELVSLLSRYVSQGKGILQPHQLLADFETVISKGDEQNIKGSAFGDVLRTTQEAIVSPPWVALAVRPRPGIWEYICVNVKELAVEELSVSEYLKFKKDLSDESFNNNFVLKPDFDPSTDSFPRPTLSKSIGNGVEFLNWHLSSKLFHDRDSLHPLLDFLQARNYKGKTMMLNDKIRSLNALQSVMKNAEEYLSRLPPETPYSKFDDKFQEMGIEKGWGDTAGHVLEMVHLLLELLETPEPCTLEKFLGRIPMVFNVVILSPHGSFSQSNVLGLPNTSGQVVYILDQVRALEHEMLLRIKQQGLDIMPRILIVTGLLPDAVGTTCNQRLEKVLGTDHASILCVPFRMDKGILCEQISRFNVQPYLETYMEDVALEIGVELNATPDLIIGNYSDGNRAASLLARKLGVTLCTTAHALEETKYLDSDIYWKKLDEKYHFSCQFPADLIAMNHTESTITSTSQEIAGRYTWKTYSERLMTLAGVYGFWKYVSKLESYLDLSSHHGSYQTSSNKTMAEFAMGHHVINVEEDHMDKLVAAVPTLVGETLAWKDVLMVVVPSIIVSAIGLVDLSDRVYVDPSHEILSKAYAFAVFTTFTLAMGLLPLSATLPRVPVSVAMVKKLMWVAVALVYIALALKAALLILS